MVLNFGKLPVSLWGQQDVLRRCLEAFDREMPLTSVYLFGSHATGRANEESDIDLCVVSVGATRPMEAAQRLRRATREIRPKPSFSIIPIDPARLKQKQEAGDHFFQTVLNEGILIVA